MGAWLALRGRRMRTYVAIGVGVLGVAAVTGLVSVGSSEIAVLVAAAVLAVGIVSVDPMLLVVLTVPATLLMNRVGGVLSLSDFVLAAGTVVALVLYRARGMRSMAPLLWAGTFYLATALPTVILNPYAANAVEFVHEIVLVLGSMVVGYTIGSRGRSSQAIAIFMVGCVVLALVTIAVGLVMLVQEKTFGPVYLPGFDKNLIGNVLAVALVIAYANPAWLSLKANLMWVAIGLFGVGILASGARQALIGAVAGLLVLSIRRRPETGRRPKLVWIVSVPAIVFVVAMVNAQLTSDNQFNSASQRLDWYAQTIQIWLQSPVFGVGLRWWYTSRFDALFQPPNAEFEVISSVGVVGLIGFLVMFAVSIGALWRINPVYGTLGVAVIATKFVSAQFDLYWVAGQASMLWIVAGICYGAWQYDRARGRELFPVAPPLRRRRGRSPRHAPGRLVSS